MYNKAVQLGHTSAEVCRLTAALYNKKGIGMKKIITLLIFIISFSVTAQDKTNNNNAAVKLANSMGLEQLLNATLSQTKNSLKEQTNSMISQITKNLPKLSIDQHEKFKKILNEYNNSVLSSIDTKKASLIYTTTLSKSLTSKEMIEAANYYNSPEGQKLLISVNEASTELNNYFLTQMGESSNKSIPAMMKKIQSLTKIIMKNKKQ